MSKATKVKQISISMPNKAGLLSEVATAIAGAKVNINTVCAYEMDNTAYFMLTTDSNAKAKKALSKSGVAIKEEDVIAVEMPNKPGELQKIAKKIADTGININYLYCTSSGKTSTSIFKTADDKKVIRLINKA